MRPSAFSMPEVTSAERNTSATSRPMGAGAPSTTRSSLASAVTGTLPNVTPQSSSYSFCSALAKSS